MAYRRQLVRGRNARAPSADGWRGGRVRAIKPATPLRMLMGDATTQRHLQGRRDWLSLYNGYKSQTYHPTENTRCFMCKENIILVTRKFIYLQCTRQCFHAPTKSICLTYLSYHDNDAMS